MLESVSINMSREGVLRGLQNRLMSWRPLVLWAMVAAAVGLSCGSSVYADASGMDVNNVDFSLHNDAYVLSANIEYRLTDTASEALRKGIPLYWDVLVKLERRREWFWDQAMADFKIRYRIQYQALLNRYRVTNISTGESDSFTTLPAALARMSDIRNFNVADRNAFKPEERYQIGIKIKFDREALPLPLRPISYVNPQWYLSSDWYIWPVQQ
ncbi:MAG: DUF4390 domain-containing protein [Gammaproteobacteria bacterium]